MSTPILAPRSNGHKSHPVPVPTARVLPLVGAKVDRLLELRAVLRTLQEEERALTAAVVATVKAQGLLAVQGTRAVALLESRTSLKVDPALFLEAAGARAPEALSVNLTAARRLLGEDDLRAISETTTTLALRVEPLGAVAA
jgi:hypothetical protein